MARQSKSARKGAPSSSASPTLPLHHLAFGIAAAVAGSFIAARLRKRWKATAPLPLPPPAPRHAATPCEVPAMAARPMLSLEPSRASLVAAAEEGIARECEPHEGNPTVEDTTDLFGLLERPSPAAACSHSLENLAESEDCSKEHGSIEGEPVQILQRAFLWHSMQGSSLSSKDTLLIDASSLSQQLQVDLICPLSIKDQAVHLLVQTERVLQDEQDDAMISSVVSDELLEAPTEMVMVHDIQLSLSDVHAHCFTDVSMKDIEQSGSEDHGISHEGSNQNVSYLEVMQHLSKVKESSFDDSDKNSEDVIQLASDIHNFSDIQTSEDIEQDANLGFCSVDNYYDRNMDGNISNLGGNICDNNEENQEDDIVEKHVREDVITYVAQSPGHEKLPELKEMDALRSSFSENISGKEIHVEYCSTEKIEMEDDATHYGIQNPDRGNASEWKGRMDHDRNNILDTKEESDIIERNGRELVAEQCRTQNVVHEHAPEEGRENRCVSVFPAEVIRSGASSSSPQEACDSCAGPSDVRKPQQMHDMFRSQSIQNAIQVAAFHSEGGCLDLPSPGPSLLNAMLSRKDSSNLLASTTQAGLNVEAEGKDDAKNDKVDSLEPEMKPSVPVTREGAVAMEAGADAEQNSKMGMKRGPGNSLREGNGLRRHDGFDDFKAQSFSSERGKSEDEKAHSSERGAGLEDFIMCKETTDLDGSVEADKSKPKLCSFSTEAVRICGAPMLQRMPSNIPPIISIVTNRKLQGIAFPPVEVSIIGLLICLMSVALWYLRM